MSAIGNVIGKAIDSATGRSSGTTLQDFLSQFSSSDGIWAKTIDPYATFDVSMKFYPTNGADSGEKGWLDTLSDAGRGAVKNLANNVTGGLIGSILNDNQNIVMDKHNNFSPGINGNCTFMEYLAAANMIVGKNGWENDWDKNKIGDAVSPLEIQFGPYCQEITLPNFEIPQGGTSQTAIGEFPINGTILKSDTNILQMKIVNTKVPLHERIFYPWMREVVSPMWHYNEQPYTTATIKIDLTKHSDVVYVFCGCRPQKIMMQQPTQDSTSSLTRDVSFLFDYMFVHSDLKIGESLADKLLDTGKTLLNSAGKLVNI